MTSHSLIHAFKPDAMGSMDAVALANAIRRGQLSVREVTEAAIARAEHVDPILHAIALRTYEQARAWATPVPGCATHAQGVFAGVPTFLKDTVDLAGHPTQLGSLIFKSAKARRDDPFTRQILAQGFNVIGKSCLPEFGFNGTTEHQDGSATANPWHTAYSAGGSSGGSAALVASGVVPIAHGNDGGGSIRIPAAACGLVGLKVSRNRLVNANVSRNLPLNLITEGVLSRTVRDTATFLAEAEKTFHHRNLPRVGLVEGPSSKRLRIGLLLNGSGDTPVDKDTLTTLLHTARLLEGAGHHVEPIQVRLTQAQIDGFLLYYGFLSFSVGRFGRLLFKGTDWDLSKYEGLSVALMHNFQRRWHQIPSCIMAIRSAAKLNQIHFAPFDVVLSPVVTHASPILGHLSPNTPAEQLLPRLSDYVGFTPLQNVLGTPGISLPMGMTTLDRRPIGVQLSAQAGQEALLLSLAFELEAQAAFPRIERHTEIHN
jgi:amidase